jgi:hypothetical protein
MATAPPVAISTSPVKLQFRRSGGAVVHARLSVWSGVGTPSEKRVLVLFFEDSLDDDETFTRALDAGIYSCVLQVFVREDLQGVFSYDHRAGGGLMASNSGNVSGTGAPGLSAQAFRHDYVLSVQ